MIRAIERMQRDVALGPEIYRPGEFWTDLLARNIEMIRDSGIANLKRTVANNYYNWLVTKQKDPQLVEFAFFGVLASPTDAGLAVAARGRVASDLSARRAAVHCSREKLTISQVLLSIT